MSDKGSKVLPILGIVGFTVFAGLAGVVSLAAFLYGGGGPGGLAPVSLVALFLALASGAAVGLLVRNLVQRGRGAEPPAERDLAKEAERGLHFRIALWARLVVAGASLAASQVTGQKPGGPFTLTASITLLLVYQVPIIAILWIVRERLDRFAIWLAVAYSAVGLVWAPFSLVRVFNYLSRSGTSPLEYLARVLVTMLAEAFVLVTAWRARRALPKEPDADKAVFATVAAIGWEALVGSFTPFFVRFMAEFRR